MISISYKKFFNNTLYNEILNQSESFMYTLFGIEKNNIISDNIVKYDEQKDIDDIVKLINLIEKFEVKKNNEINDNKEQFRKNYIKKLKNYCSQYNINNKKERKIGNDANINSMNFNTISITDSLINIKNPNIQNILNRYNTKKKIKDLEKDIIENNKIHQKSIKYNEINTEKN